MGDEDVSRIWVHPSMEEELKKWQEIFEKKTGFPAKGGIPIVSELCARVLKAVREKEKKTITVQFYKIKGAHKNNINFL